MLRNHTRKTMNFFLLPLFLIGSEAFLQPDNEGPESLKDTGFYTYQEQLFYHKDSNLNDLLNRHNKYSLTRLGQFINTATIYRKGQIVELPVEIDPNIGKVVMRTPRYGILPLDSFLSQSSNQAYLVIHKGKIIYERYDKMADYQYHAWMSITKTVVGLAMYLLEQEGVINFDKQVQDYLPDYQKTGYGRAKVRDVLNMSSGVLAIDQLFGQFIPYFRFKNTPFSPGLYAVFKPLPMVETPGVKFVYSSVDTTILTMIIENVTNMPFSRFITQRIWQNIGAEHDAAIGLLGLTMGNGHPVSGGLGLMMSSMRDLGRYGMLYTPSWNQVSKVRIFSQAHQDDLQDPKGKPNLEEFFRINTAVDDFEPGDVGFGPNDVPTHGAGQWDMIFADGDMLKLGLNSQGLYVSPGKDLVVAFFGYDDTPPEYAHAYARAIARYIADGKIQQYVEAQ